MADDKVERTDKVEKVVRKQELSTVIGFNIGSVISDPKNMQALERAVDYWMDQQEDRSVEARTAVLQQLMRGRQAMESIYSRVHQSYVR